MIKDYIKIGQLILEKSIKDSGLQDKLIEYTKNFINEIKNIRTKLESSGSFEFRIAKELQSKSPEAYKIMDVKIEYLDINLSNFIELSNKLFLLLDNGFNIKDILTLIKQLNKYIDLPIKFTTSVTGNDAWKVYLASRQELLSKENNERIY